MNDFFAGGNPKEEESGPTLEQLQEQIMQTYIEAMLSDGRNPDTGEKMGQLNTEMNEEAYFEQQSTVSDAELNEWLNEMTRQVLSGELVVDGEEPEYLQGD